MSLLKAIERLVRAGYPESTAKKIATGELPMDEASRLARAVEQGKAIDKPLIHRTNVPDILEFMPSKRGKMGAGVYTTPRQEYGEAFGNLRYDLVAEQVPATFEQRLNIVRDISKKMMAEGVDPRTAINTAQVRANEMLKSQGYTTVEMTGKRGGKETLDEVLVLDPANLRDMRRAAFDPDQVGNPNILGSAAPVAAGGILGALGATGSGQAEASPRMMRNVSEAMQESPDQSAISPNTILEALMGFLAPQAMGDATMDAYNRNRVR